MRSRNEALEEQGLRDSKGAAVLHAIGDYRGLATFFLSDANIAGQRPRSVNCNKGKIGTAVSGLIIAVSRSEDRRR